MSRRFDSLPNPLLDAPAGPLVDSEREALLSTLVDRTITRAMARPFRPESTYRLQLNAGFTFRDAQAIVPYLADLGITTCYVSPYFRASPGTTHGYDITDHAAVNPEIGTEADHEAWVNALETHGLGLLLDVVPNHMGIVGNTNAQWNDVLENGQSSRWADFFDIDWDAATNPANHGRVVLPLLERLYGDVLEAGEIKLFYDSGSFYAGYYEHRFPLAPRSYAQILAPVLGALTHGGTPDGDAEIELESILTALRNLPARDDLDPPRLAERLREKEVVKRRLAALVSRDDRTRQATDSVLESFAGQPGQPGSFDALDRLLEDQAFRLSYWRVAADEINYRRFFDVSTLVALRMDREPVFQITHRRVLDFVANHRNTGLRIDHPDGLLDPRQYLDRLQLGLLMTLARQLHAQHCRPEEMPWSAIEADLRERLGRRLAQSPASPLYVVVEKILARGEEPPAGWATRGTSGYDALNWLNGLFVDSANAPAFTRAYHDWTGQHAPLDTLIRDKKRLMLETSLASELHVLTHLLAAIAQGDRHSRDFTQNALRAALRETIAAFPVYRSYIAPGALSADDRAWVHHALRVAARSNPLISADVFRFLREVLLEADHLRDESPARADEMIQFAGKFQQVTPPVMAKGLEDTTFYIDNRLLSLNEVGGDPARFGVTPPELHAWNSAQASRFPEALVPLSTHDTKRSEDVRARLNVLSEIPDDWFAAVARWSALNSPLRRQLDGQPVPDPNEEILLYQTLVGALPLEPLDEAVLDRFQTRIRAYMAKAIHEAKVHTSWMNPHDEYDQAIDSFVASILDPNQSSPFLRDLTQFQKRISHHDMINSLAQTLLRLTTPGVPDTYQGTELWDFSLVDPDNRRPVDYQLRHGLLFDLRQSWLAAPPDRTDFLAALLDHAADGRIKLFTTWRTLQSRRIHPGLFTTAAYRPAATTGQNRESLFAFARVSDRAQAVVAVPRLTTRLVPTHAFPLGQPVWGDTTVELTGLLPNQPLQNVFDDRRIQTDSDGSLRIPAAELFARFPLALFITAD